MSKKAQGLRQGSLEELSIRNLGVIEDASIEFTSGFNVITGETGAGKTMVLTALSLILGGKSEPQLLRQSSDRLLASGRFLIAENLHKQIENFMDEVGGEIEDGSLLFSRQISLDGKSRASLGGAPSTASSLAEIGSQLIAIHGQHANLSLGKPAKQREHLDSFGGERVEDSKRRFQETRIRFLELRARIRELSASLKSRDRELAELNSLIEDFRKVKPLENELEDLGATISRLSSVESLREASTLALGALDDESGGAITALNSARRALTQLQGKDRALDDIAEQIHDSLYSLSDASSSLTRYLDGLDADPQALNTAQERKAALIAFAKRYGMGEYSESLARAREATVRVNDLQGGDEALRELERKLSELFVELRKAAVLLSRERCEAAKVLSSEVTRELAALSMPQGVFEIRISSNEIDQESEISESGVDDVEMIFSSHGGNLLPIAKAASGGELSRLLLAIELTLAGKNQLSTYVFDEVDAGIGGKAALEVGRRLHELAKSAQVIVVTHLPQVALWADRHLVVEKSENGSVTKSSLRTVDGAKRESEIARMLSGLEDSEHAQEHARELLELRKVQNR